MLSQWDSSSDPGNEQFVKLENSITIGVATKEVSMNMALFELLKGVTFSKKKKSFFK